LLRLKGTEMHAGKRSRTLTGLIGIRLLPDEVKEVEEAAERAGISKSAWLRQTINRGLKGSQDTRTMLAEVLGFRSVVLRLLAESSKGVAVSDAFIRKLLEEAETRKYAMADKCLLGREQ
jgi:hypothetical protein